MITVRLPEKTVGIPGVHYSILKQLAWRDINVVEAVSTYTALSIVLANANMDRAFVVLKDFLWGWAAAPLERPSPGSGVRGPGPDDGRMSGQPHR